MESLIKKSDEGIFLGYCENKKGFTIYNRRAFVIEEAIHVTFNKSNNDIFKSCGEYDSVGVQKYLGNSQFMVKTMFQQKIIQRKIILKIF